MIQNWLKGRDQTVLGQYFVNFVTLRIRYLFSIVRCPQNPFNSLFNGSSGNHSPKYVALKSWLIHYTGTWLLGNEVNSVTLYYGIKNSG